MSEIPDPYADDDNWNPDHSSSAASHIHELQQIDEFSEAITYYDVVGIDRFEEASADDIRRAYLDRLLDTDGDGDEERARSRADVLFEARYALLKYRDQYDQMINTLGPRLGHQTFIQWRLVGEQSNVRRWIAKHKPENQSFTDEGFER